MVPDLNPKLLYAVYLKQNITELTDRNKKWFGIIAEKESQSTIRECSSWMMFVHDEL